jgi:hypothetical protein
VKFCPTGALGPKTGNLQITSDDPANPTVNVALSGNAPAPVITVQGCPVNFGTLGFPGSATAQIQVCNTGGCTLKLTGVSFTAGSSPAFSILEPSPTPAAPFNIPAGACIPFTVLFNPSGAGTFTGSIHFDSNAPLLPLDCPVTGTAVVGTSGQLSGNGVCFDPTVIDPHGLCESSENPAVTNTGTSPVRIVSIFIDGPNASEFHFHGAPPTPFDLQPGHVLGDGNFVVDFQPEFLGPRQATLHVVVGDPFNPLGPPIGELALPLDGEGVRPGVRLLVEFSNGGVIVPPIPAPVVKEIDLQRQSGGSFGTISVQKKVHPTVVGPNGACPGYVFHVERGTLGSQQLNPVYLRPGNYRWKVTMHIGSKDVTRFIAFNIGNCTFRNLEVHF